jgi:hypothetical protein
MNSLRGTTFYRLITEALGNCAQKLDTSDIEDRVRLGDNGQTFNVVWKSDISSLFKNFRDSREYTAWA